MSRDKGQILMFSDSELDLIKSVFGDNEELLYLVRKVLLQFPITDAERTTLKATITPEVLAVLKKRIFPEVSNDQPLGQIADMYQTLSRDLQTKGVEDMAAQFEAKQLEIDYLMQQFEYLSDVEIVTDSKKIYLDDLAKLKNKSPFEQYVHTTARNFILGFIDPMLILLRSIASQKTESLEEVKKRMIRDSSK